MQNLPSIVARGILSHQRAERIEHSSIAMQDIQDRRRGKQVPNRRPLHDYANLYFDARNPMMSYLNSHGSRDHVVLRVASHVLDVAEVVITDGNAAAESTRFLVSPGGLVLLDEERVYAQWWTDSSPFVYIEKKRARCAEVLVPDVVAPELITGCYVRSIVQLTPCQGLAPKLSLEVNARVFSV